MSHKSHSAVSLQAAKPKFLGHVINAVKMEMDADGWQSCLRRTPARKPGRKKKIFNHKRTLWRVLPMCTAAV